ncbi:putative ankyrin [Triangularia verruculosa]|uniref:Ankyrin n=1 Tax=Triangularia verruculosa TaxID=2587418 RepID=A0AAN6XRC2_9PEZI|nr:putative ankyrin [Triangularia verruculosa]
MAMQTVICGDPANVNFDLIAVDGLARGLSSESSSWLKNKLEGANRCARILFYNYPLEELLHSRRAIKSHALQLLRLVRESRQDQGQSRLIVFVAADLGGLIVKEALIEASRHSAEFANIKASTRLVAFVGTPHRWQSHDELETKLAEFLSSTSSGDLTFRGIHRLAKTIVSVSHEFSQTGMLIRSRIISVYSTHRDAPKIQDHITATFGIPMEIRCAIDKPLKTGTDVQGEVCNGISEVLDLGLEPILSVATTPDILSTVRDVVMCQEPCPRPLATHDLDRDLVRWLEKCPLFEQWTSYMGCSIFHIQGPIMNLSAVAEYAFQRASAFATVAEEKHKKPFALYFKFDRNDCQRNNIASMSRMFLAQIINQLSALPSSFITSSFEVLLLSESFTDQDIFFLLNTIRNLCPEKWTTWVLDGLDQCDRVSCDHFLSQLATIATQSEARFRIFITTSDPQHTRTHLAKPGVEYLHLDLESSGDLREEEQAVGKTIFLEDEFEAFEPYSSQLASLSEACQFDKELLIMTYEWLRHQCPRWLTGTSIQEGLKGLSPPSRHALLEQALGNIPLSARRTGRAMLLWIARSVRPLASLELASALGVDFAGFQPLDVDAFMHEAFGPLLAIRDGEAQFRQPWVRELILSRKEQEFWYAPSSPENDHREIAKTCLRFLSLPETVTRMISQNEGSCTSNILLDSRHDLLSYATQYWPVHYRLGYAARDDNVPTPPELATLLGNARALGAWLSAHGALSPPHLRPNRSYLNPLPVVSYLGFEQVVKDLLKDLLSEVHGAPETVQLIQDALYEASRMGHNHIVTMLLAVPFLLPVEGVIMSMDVAATSRHFDTTEALLGYVMRKHNEKATSVQCPENLLYRLAWSGKAKLLRKLFAVQLATKSLSPVTLSRMFSCAASGGRADFITTLLQCGVEVDDELKVDGFDPDVAIMNAAVKSGSGEVTKVFAAMNVNLETKDSYGLTALQKAVLLGHHQVTKVLLDAGANTASVEVEVLTYGGSVPTPTFVQVAVQCHIQCLTLLLENGASPDANADSYTALLHSAITGNLGMAKLLLKHGARVDGVGKWNPLCGAVEGIQVTKLEMVSLLLDHGADVNSLSQGYTPLQGAAAGNAMEAAKLLLEYGADISIHGTYVDALGQASSLGHAEMVRFLLKAGCDPNRADSQTGLNAIQIAAQDKHPQCIQALLDGGAEIEAPDGRAGPLFLAAGAGCLESVKLLISRGANLEAICQDPDNSGFGFNPLLIAAMQGEVEIVRALLAAGANVRIQIREQLTALHFGAMAQNDEAVLRALLEYTPDLNALDSDHSTALHSLMLNDFPTLGSAKILVNRGTDLTIRDFTGATALHMAVAKGKDEIAKYLVSCKANINGVEAAAGGPLHIACGTQNFEMVKFLVANGAQVDLLHSFAGTPLHAAIASRIVGDGVKAQLREDIIRYLVLEQEADVTVHGGTHFYTVLNAACMQPNLALLEFIMDQGAVLDDINVAAPNGCRPIHFATFQSVEHISHVLANGAVIDVRDKLGRTILHTAIGSGRPDVVQKVLSIGGRQLVREKDRDGWTPLMWAVRRCDGWGTSMDELADIVRLLLDHGADLWATGRQGEEMGWSALRLARYYGHTGEVISLLTPKKKEGVNGKGEVTMWNVRAHRSRQATVFAGAYCDLCLYGIYGIYYQNRKTDFCLCSKCYPYRDEVFPEGMTWTIGGDSEEFLPGSRDDEGEEQEEIPDEIQPRSPEQVKQVHTVEADYWSDSDSE